MSTTPLLNTIRINPSLLSFKPRQVLLAKPNPKSNMKKALTPVLNPEQNALLLCSLAGYLKHNGFSKTLKKFLSEAQIEKDDFSDCSLDLEQMYCKYLETCDNSNGVSSKKVLEKDADSERGKENGSIAGAETISKKKKKRSGDKLTESDENKNKKSKEMKKSKMGPDSLIQEDELDDKLKNKKKRKGKLDSESLMNNVEPALEVEDKQETKTKESESETVKSKGKKKTEDGSISKNSFGGDSKVIDEQTSGKTESKNDCNKTSEEEATEKERKASKKRKRLASKENKSEPTDNTEVEESKRRKTEEQEDSKSTSDQVDGNLEKKEEKSASNKTMKKQENGSAEPKSVKAFQRVKVEEVVFTDERLKDNSYWAKDGAEIGYGAKAQEVLGQVRGRDFRHEKTKKKRGSYRGGMIDLHSHSVKFNYSDEE